MIAYSVFGDSISTFRGVVPAENRWFYDDADTNGTGVNDPAETWWGRVIERSGGRLVANASFSGAMIQGQGFPAGCSKARALQIVGKEGDLPDVVLVNMGINDYGWAMPEAQAAGGSVASPANYDDIGRSLIKPIDIDGPSADEGASSQVPRDTYMNVDPSTMAPTNAIERFQTAYEQMIQNIREVAPHAQVHCLTLSPARITGRPGHFCYSLRGVDLDEYNDAIRSACKNKGAICADVRAFGLDYSSIDGTHPDLVGMRQLADMYLASMGDESALDDYEPGMESVRPEGIDIRADREALINECGWNCYVIDD